MKGIARARSSFARRAWLIASLSCNLGILGFFKYFHFFEESTVQLLHACGLAATSSTLQIALPVGISFYTFQTMSYTLDVFFGKLQPCRRLTDFALFVAFFPQLVAGPIVRAKSFLPQLLTQPSWQSVPLRSCLTRARYARCTRGAQHFEDSEPIASGLHAIVGESATPMLPRRSKRSYPANIH